MDNPSYFLIDRLVLRNALKVAACQAWLAYAQSVTGFSQRQQDYQVARLQRINHAHQLHHELTEDFNLRAQPGWHHPVVEDRYTIMVWLDARHFDAFYAQHHGWLADLPSFAVPQPHKTVVIFSLDQDLKAPAKPDDTTWRRLDALIMQIDQLTDDQVLIDQTLALQLQVTGQSVPVVSL